MVREHDRVVLTEDLPQPHLAAGDVGTIVHIHRGGTAYEVEFVSLQGDTVAVTTLSAQQVRPVEKQEITHARRIA